MGSHEWTNGETTRQRVPHLALRRDHLRSVATAAKLKLKRPAGVHVAVDAAVAHDDR